MIEYLRRLSIPGAAWRQARPTLHFRIPWPSAGAECPSCAAIRIFLPSVLSPGAAPPSFWGGICNAVAGPRTSTTTSRRDRCRSGTPAGGRRFTGSPAETRSADRGNGFRSFGGSVRQHGHAARRLRDAQRFLGERLFRARLDSGAVRTDSRRYRRPDDRRTGHLYTAENTTHAAFGFRIERHRHAARRSGRTGLRNLQSLRRL